MKTIIPQIRKPLDELIKAKGWIWKVAIAGLCGSVTHTLLMLVKTKLGILEAFQPYQSLQIALSYWTGEYVHPLLPWLISYVNGSTAAGFSFANFYRHLPGASGPIKGFIAGVLGWLMMDLIFFPLLGLGLFATHLGLGLWPALFSLGMMLAYSVVMGTVYGIVYSGPNKSLGGTESQNDQGVPRGQMSEIFSYGAVPSFRFITPVCRLLIYGTSRLSRRDKCLL
jgi:hypothetical protein